MISAEFNKAPNHAISR